MIKDFISQVKSQGLARSSRYAVFFTPPAGVDPTSLRTALLFCDQIQLPGVNFATVQNRTFGEFRETPYEKLYDNLSMSFYLDSGMKVKTMFDRWVDKIQDPVSRNFNYYNEYTTNMNIEVQDLQNKTRYQMTLWECYPKNIGSIQLDYASKDVMKLPITMQYKYWTADSMEPLKDADAIPTSLIDRFRKDFSNFQAGVQERVSRSIGEAQNFVTGAVVQTGIQKVSSLLKF